MFEITSRTTQSLLLMRPTPAVRDVILGCLGRALHLYEIEVHAFVFMSNHFHMLVSTCDEPALPRFAQYLKSRIAERVGPLVQWRGTFWDDRYHAISVIGESAQLGRLEYILRHGCKEGLVSDPRQWPGASSVEALLDGAEISGEWLQQSALTRRRKRCKDPALVLARDFMTTYPIPITPLPCWSHLPPVARRRAVKTLIEDIARRTAAENAAVHRVPMGARAVMTQDPHSAPVSTKHSPPPLVHADSSASRAAYRAAYDAYVAAFRAQVLSARSASLAPTVLLAIPARRPSRERQRRGRKRVESARFVRHAPRPPACAHAHPDPAASSRPDS